MDNSLGSMVSMIGLRSCLKSRECEGLTPSKPPFSNRLLGDRVPHTRFTPAASLCSRVSAFALIERKGRNQEKEKHRSAAGKHADCVCHNFRSKKSEIY